MVFIRTSKSITPASPRLRFPLPFFTLMFSWRPRATTPPVSPDSKNRVKNHVEIAAKDPRRRMELSSPNRACIALACGEQPSATRKPGSRVEMLSSQRTASMTGFPEAHKLVVRSSSLERDLESAFCQILYCDNKLEFSNPIPWPLWLEPYIIPCSLLAHRTALHRSWQGR